MTSLLSAATSADTLFVQPEAIFPSRFRKTARRSHVGVALESPDVAESDKLSTYPDIPIDLIDCFSPAEWKQRCALAVSYRIAYLHDWHENIFNHITLKVDGSDEEADGPHSVSYTHLTLPTKA